MNVLEVNSYTGSYEAEFCSNFSFIEKIAEIENAFFVVDKQVYQLYEQELRPLFQGKPNFLMEAIEENKNIQEALCIAKKMLVLPSKRNTVLVAIGGGIVQDVSAFVANILYRGISWVLVPTTLLAQTDSCIGSKSSLNFEHYKNILGYFYPPRRIYVNTNFIRTLTDRDYLSGLGEIIKCALMAGYESFLSTANNLSALVAKDEKALIREIEKALRFKKKMIELDEFDRGPRNVMNFGHTFGHALESTSDYAIPHGQAVSYGMMVANDISCKRQYITNEMKQDIQRVLFQIVTTDLLKSEYISGDAYLQAMKHDKKYTGGMHTCILFHGDGVEKHSDVTDAEIMDATKSVLGEFENADRV